MHKGIIKINSNIRRTTIKMNIKPDWGRNFQFNSIC